MAVTPSFPPEFFQFDELVRLSGSPQRARIIHWMVENRIPHVIGMHGYPLVYRTNLLPAAPEAAQNAQSEPTFDFSAAIHAPRRTPAHRRAS